MPYRFIRKISNSVAEVSTPNGRTIRLPYTGSLPDKGGIVKPILGGCCCPKKLSFPIVTPTNIRTTPDPRRHKRGSGSTVIPNIPVIYRGDYFELKNFPFNPDLPSAYTVIYQPAHSDYPASKFPIMGIGVVIKNSPQGPSIQGLTPVRFGKVAYQLEHKSFGTAYDNWGNITYYSGILGLKYGSLTLYKYNPQGKVSDKGITIQEYVENHKTKYPLSDNFYFEKYYIGEVQEEFDLSHIGGTPGYSANFIVSSIQPKTKYFMTFGTGRDFITDYKDLDYVEI